MANPWTFASEPPASGHEIVTLLEGATFCLSDEGGDIAGDAALGVFFRDARILSTWRLRIDGEPLLPMAHERNEPFAATFITRARPGDGRADSTVLVVRHRLVGDGLREEITVRNLGLAEADLNLTLDVDADFADLFAVKEGRAGVDRSVTTQLAGSVLTFSARGHWHERGAAISASRGAVVGRDGLAWHLTLAPRQSWSVCVLVRPSTDGQALTPRHQCGEPAEASAPFSRLMEWRQQSLAVVSPRPGLARATARGIEDLGALRIFDPNHPNRAVVAAGSPWFMALFGRDSLLTAWMLLPVDRHLAMDTLRTLAELQGARVHAETEEEPGRILHEVRFGPQAALWLGGRNVYFGTADATPLFVMLLAEAWRWGADADDVAALLPAADRALTWVTTYGDRDGDGFVEYARSSPQGLLHQGWKDSVDGITFADGAAAQPPIALAEVQGYVYAAYRGRAALAREFGEPNRAAALDTAADALKRRFNDTFWLPDRGWFAMGLDGAKRPIDSLASNMGHCLWTGIVDEDKAGAVADRLLSPPMFSGWGVRTLAATSGAYNPMSYHNGSVWPHDNAIIAAGLARYGFRAQAQRIALAQFDAAEALGDRLPELFCGFDRTEFTIPVPYPAACSPQAWASAAPLLLLRALLGLEPDVPAGVVTLDASVPPDLLPLTVRNVLLNGVRTTIRVTEAEAEVVGLPDRLAVPRRAQTRT